MIKFDIPIPNKLITKEQHMNTCQNKKIQPRQLEFILDIYKKILTAKFYQRIRITQTMQECNDWSHQSTILPKQSDVIPENKYRLHRTEYENNNWKTD